MRDKIFYGLCAVYILFLLFSDSYIKKPPEVFESLIDQEIAFQGVIVENPEVRRKDERLVIQIEEKETAARVLLTTPKGADLDYGDTVKFTTQLKHPENFITDQGKEFDYVNYLKKDDIFYTGRTYNLIKLEAVPNQGNPLKSFLFTAKNKFLSNVNYSISEPESFLMSGLILGDKSDFSNELQNDFVRTGTAHIVALSGYNITIVANWVVQLFRSLPFALGIYWGILAIVLFVLMTGASSTAIRAGIMAAAALVARRFGRPYDAGRALLLAAMLMLVINPMLLRYDVSFQLSFLATIAIIFLTPKIEKYFYFVPKRFGLREIFTTSISAYIFVLPFILYKMGNLSLVALPANLLVLPFIPLTMILGFITGITGFLSPFLSLFMGYISYVFLYYELSVIHVLSSLSFASLSIPNFPLWATIAIYAWFAYKLFGRTVEASVVSMFKKEEPWQEPGEE